MGRTGTAVGTAASPASDVFGLLTDIDRLSEWNTIIVKVFERPETLSPGAEWVVQLKALGNNWASRSTIEEYDPSRGVFPTSRAPTTGTRRTRAGGGRSKRRPAVSRASR
jgi:Polyketide cyclase / dehydrase and lipid transport